MKEVVHGEEKVGLGGARVELSGDTTVDSH